jgi:hypothetical protein
LPSSFSPSFLLSSQSFATAAPHPEWFSKLMRSALLGLRARCAVR